MLTQGTEYKYEKNKNKKGKMQWRKFFLLPNVSAVHPFGQIKKYFIEDFLWEQSLWFSSLAPYLFLNFDYMDFMQRKSPQFLAEVVTSPTSEDTKHFMFSQSSW